MGGLSNRNLFSHRFGGWNQDTGRLSFCGGFCPGLAVAVFT